jgi:hypothetical protein
MQRKLASELVVGDFINMNHASRADLENGPEPSDVELSLNRIDRIRNREVNGKQMVMAYCLEHLTYRECGVPGGETYEHELDRFYVDESVPVWTEEEANEHYGLPEGKTEPNF